MTSGYRDRSLTEKLSERIRKLAGGQRFLFMHVCGTHEATIVQYGLRSLLPEGVEVRSGPGCPVCVTSPTEVESAIQLSLQKNVIVTTFGDMFRVPSSAGSLADARAKGGTVRLVYSIHDATEMARSDPSHDYVHFAIGFETTAPATAAELIRGPPENFSVLCSHRLVPPAITHLLESGEVRIDGFILPGHVSTIIGTRPYRPISERFKAPQVIAGFEPVDVMIAIAMLLEQIKRGVGVVENEYVRSVREEGNVKAQEVMETVFDVCDADWRGIGSIPRSGFRLRPDFQNHDAPRRFGVGEGGGYEVPTGCRCGEVLRGLAYPEECPLFMRTCKPLSPVGPCAVSREGACYIAMRSGAKKLSDA